MSKKSLSNRYIQTINGQLAFYSGEQICYAHSGMELDDLLLTSLTEVRKQQRSSRAWRLSKGYGDTNDYGYIRLSVVALKDEKRRMRVLKKKVRNAALFAANDARKLIKRTKTPVPPITCPKINLIQAELSSVQQLLDDIESSMKNKKALSKRGLKRAMNSLRRIDEVLEEVRSANSTLRELGFVWYETSCELYRMLSNMRYVLPKQI